MAGWCPRPVIDSDGWRGYGGPVGLGYGRFRGDHSGDAFTKGASPIDGIEGFRGLTKVRLAKFKGCPDTPFVCISRTPSGATPRT